MYPSFHSVGISSCSYTFPIRSCSISVEVSISISALVASVGILSGPEAFLSLCDV